MAGALTLTPLLVTEQNTLIITFRLRVLIVEGLISVQRQESTRGRHVAEVPLF